MPDTKSEIINLNIIHLNFFNVHKVYACIYD